MKLWLYRAQRRRWLGRPRYLLTVRLGVDRVEGAALVRHRLLQDEVYASPSALALDAAMESLLDLSDEVAGHDREAIKKRMSLQRAALAAARAGERETRITIAEALLSTTIVAHDIVELMMVEAGVRGAFAALEAKLARLIAHERGEEDVIEAGSDAEDTSPAGWGDTRRIKL